MLKGRDSTNRQKNWKRVHAYSVGSSKSFDFKPRDYKIKSSTLGSYHDARVGRCFYAENTNTGNMKRGMPMNSTCDLRWPNFCTQHNHSH